MTEQLPITDADKDAAVVIDAGTLEFSAEDMTATGLLVPFGVQCRSNLGMFTYAAGDIALPTDLGGMSLNVEHKREDVVGSFTKVWEQPEGVMATFRYRDTPEGRQAFEDGKSGKRKNLSAEVAKVRIRDGKALPGSVLFAAAQVEKPAFEGATLLAAEDTATSSHDEHEFTDENGVTWRRVEDSTTTVADDGNTTTTETTVTTTVTEPEPTPAEEPTTEETGEFSMSDNNAGALVTGTPTKDDAPAEVELGTVFASIAAVKGGMSAQTADAETLLAALSDIKVNATGGLTTSASGVIQPAWVGKLWQGLTYVRKYIDLGTHLYGGIQLGGRKGFTLDQGTALVQHWNGNKSEIPSGSATTGTKASSLQKYAYGADVAREWYDLEGGAEVIQAFFEGVVDSYAELTDEDALKAIFATAAGASLANLRPAGTYPADYPASMGLLIDAIETVSEGKDEATFAVVNPAAYRELLFTPKDLVPEFVSFAFRAGSGAGTADGKVAVVKAPDEFFVGLDPTEPAVISGAKRAIEFREQGSTPIQVDALDIAKGGIDKAVIGYMETFVVRPESFVLFGTEAE
ncbi:hypothetical protein [Microbacterium sp. MTN4-26]|uniref:hypothetical protein n=1 Tax=unclassified Microbacterium TaxID=2609290 RepID=UPI0036F29795